MKEKTEWKRTCLECGEKIYYSTKRAKIRAEKWNTNCRSCIWGSKEIRKKMSESHKGKVPWNKGKTNVYSEEIRDQMGEKNKGKPSWNKGVTKETNDSMKRISESLKGRMPWNKGKTNVYSEETLKEMRLSAIKRGIKYPNYSPVACKIIDEYSKKYNFNFQHAENGGEVCIDGYWPDGLDEERKTMIEVDEKQHFNPDGTFKQKDIRRQKYLESLGYKFIRIKI